MDAVVRDGCHVEVHAVAGAGKTTTVLHVAAALSGRLLVLTYNAKLKSETRERCTRIPLKNVAVHTYHSAALNMYNDASCARDEGLSDLVADGTRRILPLHDRAYTVLVVDEAQDMTHLYFALVRRLLHDACVQDARVVMLGDARQSVYGFKGADARFLTLAPRIALATDARSWRQHTLSTTYRLAPNLANFVNAHLLDGADVLQSSAVSTSPGHVRYARCNTYGDLPYRQVEAWLKTDGMTGSDIFVLAPSIRVNAKQSPLRILENRLVRAGIRCYAASSDDERLDEDVTRGKIVFATFHQVKGLERKAVMVFGFDASYHTFFERCESACGCPNEIYVAATRAKQYLTLLHDSRHGPMRTVKMSRLGRDCEFIEDGSHRSVTKSSASRQRQYDSDRSVTELLRHQREDVLKAAMACLTVRDWSLSPCQCPSSYNTLLKGKTETGDDSWENVAAITGTAMPCIFEFEMSGRCTLLTRAAASKGLPPKDLKRVESLYTGTDSPTVSDFLYIANVHIALTGGFLHKLCQIQVYDWVLPSDVASMLNVMRRHVTGASGVVLYEHPASLVVGVGMGSRRRMVRLSCAIDCLDASTHTCFEIKCVTRLSSEHLLQTALNALLLEGEGERDGHVGYRHVLLNLCDGSAKEIVFDRVDVMRAAVLLLEAKYAAERVDDDDAFLKSLGSGWLAVARPDTGPRPSLCTRACTYAFVDE